MTGKRSLDHRLLFAILLAFCARTPISAAADVDWPTHGGTYLEQRFSPLHEIDTGSVKRLSLAWYVDLDTNRGQESTPLVVDGKMFVTTAWSKVWAVDAASGRVLWTYDPKVPGPTGFSACCDVVNRGAAYYEGTVYVGTLDGRLIALNAQNGKLVWSQFTVDTNKPYTITGAPRVVRGKVIVGNGGADYGVRGYVTAYDARSGAKIWRFYTVPGDPHAEPDGEVSDAILKSRASETWFGDFWKLGGGGTVYDAIVYDPELNQLYLGVGNGSPWNRRIRSEGKGDNLFLSSIVAVDPDTGRYLWHYQETPGETWDFTATQPISLATLTIDGKPRKVLMQAPKNGFFYVIDRTDGKLISAQKYVPVNWASGIDPKSGRPIEAPEARFANAPFVSMPGGGGGHNWQPMSFSPATGLVYIPAQELPFLYANEQHFQIRPGGWNTGVDMLALIPPDSPEVQVAIKASLKGRLLAWDPVTQKAAWKVEHAGPWNGGVLSTAGNLVFQGAADGNFESYDARTGELLWSFAAQTGVMAGPISYSLGGRQYVAVVAGYGGAIPLALASFDGPQRRPNGRVLVFALDGHATLPPFEGTPGAPVPGTGTWPADIVARGRDLYGINCIGCHGLATLSAGVLPDLRRSSALASQDAWRSIVIRGALSDAGMISFAKYLSADEAEAIRAYVTNAARAAARP
jgi:quinohemoprotein ethanol dehydrogenase